MISSEQYFRCHDCGHRFSEFDALNASLAPDEFNAACPECGGDYVVLATSPCGVCHPDLSCFHGEGCEVYTPAPTDGGA